MKLFLCIFANYQKQMKNKKFINFGTEQDEY